MEENQRLKVIYGSEAGFHAIDLDTNTVFDLYLCPKVGCLHLLPTLSRLMGRIDWLSWLCDVMFQVHGCCKGLLHLAAGRAPPTVSIDESINVARLAACGQSVQTETEVLVIRVKRTPIIFIHRLVDLGASLAWYIMQRGMKNVVR